MDRCDARDVAFDSYGKSACEDRHVYELTAAYEVEVRGRVPSEAVVNQALTVIRRQGQYGSWIVGWAERMHEPATERRSEP